MSKPSTIAIDGPSAAGKTTLGRQLAETLGYLYFDTGVMYRAVTLVALQRGIDVHDEQAVTALAGELHIDVLPPTVADGRPSTVLVDGEDVTWRLREADIDAHVSIPSTYTGVRAAMTAQQRRIAARGHVVMVGRDIGTVVLPDADLKLYIDATLEERARRRWLELQRNGHELPYEEVLASLRNRDYVDSQRAVAPLQVAEDAIVIDTNHMDAAQTLAYVLELIEQRGGS